MCASGHVGATATEALRQHADDLTQEVHVPARKSG